MKNYLPSKKFTYFLIALIVLGLGFFLFSSILSGKDHFLSSSEQAGLQPSATLNDLLQKDSDGDGIPDWEEALWGTDPNNKTTFNGEPDADYIKKKREGLNLSPDSTATGNTGNLTETDKFAQEFFASLSAMKQSGQVDPNTINNVSTALGQKIVDPTMVDKYTQNDIKLNNSDGATAQKDYYSNVQKLFNGYKENGLGDELEIASSIASEGTNTADPTGADKLENISNSYQDFAQKMTQIPVPKSLVQYHIEIINNANNTGIAVGNMVKIANDPVVGLSGLSQYQKYSDDLISSVGELQTILQNNGIILQ